VNKLIQILIVDDEEDILNFLGYNLKKEGYVVHTANSGPDGLEMAKEIIPDVILLDVMMPGMDGIETCIELRKVPKLENVLVAFLTARNEDYSQISGLDAGADDYITKPIRPKVLLSRIKALLRRQRIAESEDAVLQIGPLKIDRTQYLVFVEDKELKLPRKEFELLALLARKPGKVFSRVEILNNVWGQGVIVGDRTIDVHIRKLREKLGEDHIKTVKGVGYKLDFK